ncbi:hypothetical protein YC2023_079007 [Brassica napus]
MDQCDFILHEACAKAPFQKQHAIHAHSLTLKKVGNIQVSGGRGHFYCWACGRLRTGFVYEDPNSRFHLDLRRASVAEPFQYEGHEHPLFLALIPEEEESAICQICQEEGEEDNNGDHQKPKLLTCIECKYIICFKCATLPYKARYKYDNHFLIFRKKEEGNDHHGWCDICESKIIFSRKGGFYSCDDYCSTTVHVDCLLGKYPYMKPGQIRYWGRDVVILRNKTMSRPLCHDIMSSSVVLPTYSSQDPLHISTGKIEAVSYLRFLIRFRCLGVKTLCNIPREENITRICTQDISSSLPRSGILADQKTEPA